MISQIIDGVERQVSSASSGQVTQYAIMPAYTDFTLGKIIQYTGVTNANYTKGYFYVRGTNGWEPQPVQSGNVISVNGKTGTVVLNAGDVGTSPTIVAYRETSPATAAHAVDTYIYYDDTTYKVKTAIDIGDSLVVNTNIEALNLTEMESTVIYIPEDEGDTPVSNLSDLGDVSLSSLANGQVLKYNSTSQKWENVSLGTAAAKDSTNVVTQNSTNLVESGAVYTGLSSKADLTDLAPAFSSVNAYAIGDYVTYDGDLYKFTSAHSAGEWVAADATKVAVATEVSGKTDKVTSATSGNLASLDATGNLADAGAALSALQPKNMSAPAVIGGASQTTVEGAINALNTFNNPGTYLRLTDLGTSYTAELKQDISSGKFEIAKVGGYLTINSHVYYIAHLDYWLHTGGTECTTHHAVVVPASSSLISGKMNNSNVVTGAYAGSDFKTGANSNTALADIKAIIQADFGSANILTHRELFANAVDGNSASSGWAWADSDIDLMNETMVYGHCVCSKPGTYGHLYEVGIDKTQLELFAKRPDLITTRGYWWLRDVVNSTDFAIVISYGNANDYNASGSFGIRPAFAIC